MERLPAPATALYAAPTRAHASRPAYTLPHSAPPSIA